MNLPDDRRSSKRLGARGFVLPLADGRHIGADEGGTTRATAQLPGLEIEIIHRRSPADDAELISINLQAGPSFEAFGRYLETVNPFAFWTQFAQMTWLPWLEATRAAMLPLSMAPPKLGRGEKGRPPIRG